MPNTQAFSWVWAKTNKVLGKLGQKVTLPSTQIFVR